MSVCVQSIAQCKGDNKQKFWLDDFSELYKNNNFLLFYPKFETTRTEQMNAITRFLIYFTILVLLFAKNKYWTFAPIVGLVLIVLFYYVNMADPLHQGKEFERLIDIRGQNLLTEQKKKQDEVLPDGKPDYELKDIDEGRFNWDNVEPFNIESGTYDSNGDLRISGEDAIYPPKFKGEPRSIFTTDEVIDYQKKSCRKPSKDNPFMNPNLMDYNTEGVPEACNVDDNVIKDDMYVNYNDGLFRDVDDLWSKMSGDRAFYSVPNTSVPNNQGEYAKWLFLTPSDMICKSDGAGCIYSMYNDLRYVGRG